MLGGDDCSRSAQARQVICELDQLRVVDRLQHLGHRRLVAVPSAALVFAQRLQQVILALVGEARDIFLPGKIRAVADIAVVELDQSAGTLKSRRVAGIGGRLRRRQRGDKIRRLLQIRVATAFRQLSHRLDGAEPLTEHKKLDQHVFRRLHAERRHILDFRLTLRPMADKAGLELLRRRCGKDGERAGQERCGNSADSPGAHHQDRPSGVR